VTVWDLGGQTGLRTLWERYFDDADALVFVIDWSDVERVAEARAELIAALETGHREGDEGGSLSLNAPLFVAANKMDLCSGDAIEIAERLALTEVVGARPWLLLPTSAKTGEGFAEGFHWLLLRIAEERAASGVDQD
jgi:GTPase SAR1 family protein